MEHCIWINSDLQLNQVDLARTVLRNAVEDVLSLDLPLVEAWCLGDALVGSDLDALETVADESVALYERLGVPIAYVMGNHEMDLKRATGMDRFPLYERVKDRAGWHTMESLSDFYFVREVLGHKVVFMGDHAAEDGSWFTSGGILRGEMKDQYPHLPAGYAALREAIAVSDKPVLTVSHYALRGGQRPSKLLDALLPLPDSVRAHFHGHAHIGDMVWNKDNPWERVNPIEGSQVLQFNVSALETLRSPGSHSAVLTFRQDGSLWVRFRCHLEREWIREWVIPPVVTPLAAQER